MRFGIRDLVLEEIVQLAEKHNLDILMLFGSRARGDYKKQVILIWQPVEVI